MSRATKVRYERHTITLTPEALAFINACKLVTMKDQDKIAKGLADASIKGNATAARMLFALSSISPPRPADEDEESPCSRTFALLEGKPLLEAKIADSLTAGHQPEEADAPQLEPEQLEPEQLELEQQEQLEPEQHELEQQELEQLEPELTAC